MLKFSPRITALLAATATAGISGAAIAGAASSGPTGATGTPSAQERPAGGAGQTALSGETKQKVEAAALAKVPGGTILRTTTDRGGVYESHVRKADGSEVEVKVAKDFTVTAVEERGAGGRGPGGPGGRGPHADTSAVAQALGVSEAKLQSALEAARPDKPAGERGPGAERAAAIAKALGESTSDVQAVLDAARGDEGPGDRGPGRGPGPGGHDDTALVAALAKEFSVSQAKAQAAVEAAERAHRAEHTARETAMYAAVAKALGKDASAVQKAFEAGRPTPPTP